MTNQQPPTHKACSVCHGIRRIIMGRNIGDTGWIYDDCSRCNGSGKYPIYYTPNEYTAWMQEHVNPEWTMPEHRDVWYKVVSRDNWILGDLATAQSCAEIVEPYFVAIVGQPKPPRDWREE